MDASNYIQDTIQNCTVRMGTFGTKMHPISHSVSLAHDGKPYTQFSVDVDMSVHSVNPGFHKYEIQCGHLTHSDIFGFPFGKKIYSLLFVTQSKQILRHFFLVGFQCKLSKESAI